jgi:hypothetical protein
MVTKFKLPEKKKDLVMPVVDLVIHAYYGVDTIQIPSELGKCSQAVLSKV